MSYLNLWYRALKKLDKDIADNRELSALFDALKKSPRDGDYLLAERTYCIIDDDWVEKIEKELIFVANAIEEDRQFIVQNGQVVPIEKIRKVSSASVRHLARHSSLLTKEPEEDKDIIPDKLYMVENLTDYAVYENRFLYMLLCYLRDFIDVRLQEILEVGNTYRGRMVVQKDVRIKKRHLTFNAELFDEDKNDPYAHLYTSAVPQIERIQTQFHLVMSLLATPLMKEVSKVPMIKPPITKTNVLKMNNNFVHAMELYHFVSSYTKKGYQVEKISNNYKPITDAICNEYLPIIALNAYVCYKYGNKMQAMLEKEFKQELLLEKEQEKDALCAKVAMLKERLSRGETTLEEYVLALEESNKALEESNAKYVGISKKLEVTEQKNKQLLQQVETLGKSVEYYQREIDKNLAMVQAEKDNCEQLRLSVLERQNQLEADFQSKNLALDQLIEKGVAERAESIKAQFDAEYQQSKQALESDYRKFKQEFVEEQNQSFATQKQGFEQREKQVLENIEKIKKTLAEQDAELKRVKDEKALYGAELHALRQRLGLSSATEDFTSAERFDELEMEFEAFAKFFRANWARAKKRIRKEILWKMKNDGENKTPPTDIN